MCPSRTPTGPNGGITISGRPGWGEYRTCKEKKGMPVTCSLTVVSCELDVPRHEKYKYVGFGAEGRFDVPV